MDIVNVTFENSLKIKIKGQDVEIIPFRTQEPGNIKFGIKAPRTINVHREEIYHAIKLKESESQ